MSIFGTSLFLPPSARLQISSRSEPKTHIEDTLLYVCQLKDVAYCLLGIWLVNEERVGIFSVICLLCLSGTLHSLLFVHR